MRLVLLLSISTAVDKMTFILIHLLTDSLVAIFSTANCHARVSLATHSLLASGHELYMYNSNTAETTERPVRNNLVTRG